jgi:hypothetical protein
MARATWEFTRPSGIPNGQRLSNILKHSKHISAILSFFKFQNVFPILHELPNTSSQAKPKLSPSEAHLTHVDNASFDSLERR